MEDAVKHLFLQLNERGYQGRVVPTHHLQDLREEIEGRHEQGLLNDEFYQAWLSRFEFKPPEQLGRYLTDHCCRSAPADSRGFCLEWQHTLCDHPTHLRWVWRYSPANPRVPGGVACSCWLSHRTSPNTLEAPGGAQRVGTIRPQQHLLCPWDGELFPTRGGVFRLALHARPLAGSAHDGALPGLPRLPQPLSKWRYPIRSFSPSSRALHRLSQREVGPIPLPRLA